MENLVHYSREQYPELRPLTYEELSKDRSQGRWENKPNMVAKYVQDRKLLENYLRGRLKSKGIQHDPNKSFLYATIEGREQFGQPDQYKHTVPLDPKIINSSFFGYPGSRTYFGQPGLDKAIKKWDELKSQNKLKEEQYMGMTIRPRIEVMTPLSLKPTLVEKTASIQKEAPFKSEAQRKFLWANKKTIAKRWSKEYPNQHDLPEHVKKKAYLAYYYECFQKAAGKKA